MAISGDKWIKHAFKILPNNVFKRVLRKANHNAMTPALKEARVLSAKSNWKDSIGATAKAMTKKTKMYGKTFTAFSIVGAKADYSQIKTSATGKSSIRKPNKYAHLLEHGHRLAPRIKGARLDRIRRRRDGTKYFVAGNSQPTGSVRAFKVIERAFKAAKSAIVNKWNHEFDTGFKKEASKLGLRP